jgi:hypothetical protein
VGGKGWEERELLVGGTRVAVYRVFKAIYVPQAFILSLLGSGQLSVSEIIPWVAKNLPIIGNTSE